MLDPEFFIFDGGPVVDKLGYILDNVYPNTRNSANWLEYEFKYRQALNQQIKFAHTDLSSGWESRPGHFDSKVNYFSYSANPELLVQYHKLVIPQLELDTFFQDAYYERQQAEEYVAQYNGCLIDAEKIFVPVLDQNLYQRMCEFGGFASQYNSASIVHSAWWNARNRTPTKYSASPSPWLCPYVITEIT